MVIPVEDDYRQRQEMNQSLISFFYIPFTTGYSIFACFFGIFIEKIFLKTFVFKGGFFNCRFAF